MTQSHNDKLNTQFNRMHLFLLRVWHEPGSDGEAELHGRLQRVVNGESRSFQGLDGLTKLLETLVQAKPHPRKQKEQQERCELADEGDTR